jgi:tetratricopeptide (TPR) repeat protein
MDAVTYPSPEVVSFVNNNLIPLRINVIGDKPLDVNHYFWTPTLALLDYNGNELQRTIGFLGEDEFIASMLLGIAKVHLDAGQYDTGLISLKNLLETLPKSTSVPEAIYFRGVILYKETNDPGKLKEAYVKLINEYPDSVWSERAYPYRLL